MLKNEEWRPIPGYEGAYEVSNLGNVRSVDRRDNRGRQRKGVTLKPGQVQKGYPQVCLRRDGSGKYAQVCRLVLLTFVGDPPEGCQAYHENGDPADNRLSNLRWATVSERSHGQVQRGTHPNSRKTECVRGHTYQEPNLVPSELRAGKRRCRACERARWYTKRHPHLKDQFQSISDEKYNEIMTKES